MSVENKRLKIAYLTCEDPKSRRSWSGITYYMAQALQKYCGDVYFLGPQQCIEDHIGSILNKGVRFFLKKQVAYDHLFFIAKKHARLTTKKISGRSFDVIFAPIGTSEVAFLETDIPIVIAEDATFTLLHDYYTPYSHLLRRSAYEAYRIQEMAYKKAHALFLPSEWAARSAVEDCHVEQHKVHVVPLGANFDEIPPGEISQKRKKSDRCRLLFVGIDWERKGGEIAYETLLKLEEMGIPAELVICGTEPPKEFIHERMKVIPFLDKSDERQYKELVNLFISSDFLLVPTRKECFGLVFCEASAFGLPSITTNIGGVSGAVREGENGFLLPEGARGSEYARLIAEIYQDEQRYIELARSSRTAFENRLNWDAWGVTVSNLLTQMLALQHPVY